MIDPANVFLAKAQECLAGAESEYANERYNNCGNRSYYACFQAAVHALIGAGFRPRGRTEQWSHEFVQASFVRELINRRKVYPGDLRQTLSQTMALRHASDYEQDYLTEREARRTLRQARALVQAVAERVGEKS